MANPRFPPTGSPAWFAFAEQWILKERVDNERQWRLLRQVTGLLTGLDPIQDIVDLRFPTTTTSTTTTPPTTTTTTGTSTTTAEPTTTTSTTTTEPTTTTTSTTTSGDTSTTTAAPTSTTTAEDTSTTTAEPTSTTTAGETSTTTAVCTGNCHYVSVVDGGSPTGFSWSLDSSTCSASCASCAAGTEELFILDHGRPDDILDTLDVACSA